MAEVLISQLTFRKDFYLQDMLQIHQLIIHELEKESDSPEAILITSDECVPIDERAEALVAKLNSAFIGKAEVLQGYLSSPEDALFPGYFQEWINQGLSKEAFINFSKETMQALQLSLQGIVGAKGGYLVYADYHSFETRMLGVFLVRDTEGVVFRRNANSGSFDLDTITYLNIDRLALACRLHLDKEQDGSRYAEMIKHARSQKEISAYFINWIGLEQPESSKDLTHTFLEVVSQLPLPVSEETGETMPEENFREEVMNFALNSPQKMIEVKKFDQEFYGGQGTTQQFLTQNDIGLEQSFRYDDNTLRRFYNCRVYSEGISLSFNRGHFQRRQVEIEGDSIIIRSPELVEKIMQMMEEG